MRANQMSTHHSPLYTVKSQTRGSKDMQVEHSTVRNTPISS